MNFWKKWKKKKILGDIITLHLGTTNYDHIMYGSWDMEHDRQNFFSCFDHFLPFYPKKIKILKWWKKYLEISSFRTCVPKIMIRSCLIPEIWCMTNRQTDGLTDLWKKWHKKVGAQPRKDFISFFWVNFVKFLGQLF